MIERYSRREFLKKTWPVLLAPILLNDVEVKAESNLTFGELVERGNYEPERVYPILHNLADVPAEYTLPAGRVSTITEAELVAAFRNLQVTDTNAVFMGAKGKSNYLVSHSVSLDPYLYGKAVTEDGQLHRGSDWVTDDPHNENTILTNPLGGRLLGFTAPDEISRLSTHTPIIQLVDRDGQDLIFSFGGRDFAVIMLYGHLKPIKISLPEGQVIPVGTPLGDITANQIIGASSSPHCHVEMVAVPPDKIDSIHDFLHAESFSLPTRVIYLDTNFLWKFLPGDRYQNTGLKTLFWDDTKDLKTWRAHHGK